MILLLILVVALVFVDVVINYKINKEE